MFPHQIPSPKTSIPRKRARAMCHALVAILVLQLSLPPGLVPFARVEEARAAATLVGHYKFDETTSNATVVSTGGGHNLTAANFAAPATASSGPDTGDLAPNVSPNTASLHFDGSDDFASAQNPGGALTNYVLSTFSLATWVKPDAITGTHQILIKKGSIGASTQRINFLLQINPTTGTVSFGYSEDDSPGNLTPYYVFVTSVASISAGQWTHLAGTFDGTTLKLYINGSLTTITGTQGNPAVTSGSATSFTPDAANRDPQTSVASEFVTVGAQTNTSGVRSLFFDGRLDDMRVYQGALTAGEVADLYDPSDTYSGTAFTDAGSTHVTNGTTINVLKDGVLAGTDTTTSGAFDINIDCSEGDVLTFYVDGADTDAVTVTRCGTGDVAASSSTAITSSRATKTADPDGFPMTGKRVFDLCFRASYGKNTLTPQDIRGNLPDNTDVFIDSKTRKQKALPADCASYHPNSAHVWTHPDGYTFTYDPQRKTYLLPEPIRLVRERQPQAL
jgi:hypothetical protein